MTPLALAGLGPTELLIILAVVLLLFGGSRLAGLGKSSGRALREFKEETRSLRDKPEQQQTPPVTPSAGQQPVDPTYPQAPRTGSDVPDTSGTETRRDVGGPF